MPITTLYALPLAFILLTLTFRTIGYRRSNRISLGDNGDKALLKRMRVHANCAEYTPIGLVLMGLAESMDTPAVILHAIGISLSLAAPFMPTACRKHRKSCQCGSPEWC